MWLEEVTVMNDAAIYYLHRNRSAEAMQLLETAWMSFQLNKRRCSVCQSPQGGQDQELLLQSPRLVPPSPRESSQTRQSPSLELVVDEAPALFGNPFHRFPARGCSANSDFSQSVVPIDFYAQSTHMNDSSGDLVRIDDDMDQTVSQGCTFSIYMRAFLLENNDRGTHLSAFPRSMSRIPAVILYNTGLVFHRLGTESGESAFFHKAIELYKLSFYFLENSTDVCTHVPESERLVLALMNNLGYCHTHFNDTKDVSLCRQRISEVLLLSANMSHLTCGEYIFFSRVALLSGRHYPALAPAA